MTGSIARRVAVAAAVTVFGVLSVSAVGVAQATDGTVHFHHEHSNYPPKSKLTLVADRATVPVRQKVTLTANYVGSGCSVKFTFGKQTKTVGSQNGIAQVTFVSTATHGTVQASATTVGCKLRRHTPASRLRRRASPCPATSRRPGLPRLDLSVPGTDEHQRPGLQRPLLQDRRGDDRLWRDRLAMVHGADLRLLRRRGVRRRRVRIGDVLRALAGGGVSTATPGDLLGRGRNRHRLEEDTGWGDRGGQPRLHGLQHLEGQGARLAGLQLEVE